MVLLAISLIASVTVAHPRGSAAATTSQLAQQQASADVAVFAKGGTGAEKLELRIDGKTVKRFVMTTRLREFNYSTTKAIGRSSLSLHFVNDASVANGDRNVTIDRVHVNDIQFQTEAASVVTLGAFVGGSCKKQGTFKTESLTCNGFARFDIGTAGRPMLSRLTPPKHPSHKLYPEYLPDPLHHIVHRYRYQYHRYQDSEYKQSREDH